ncbi:MAG TPA: hypothetical protein VEZ90_10105, partial [Blastocatellia bacterium]|nr:hypothetical protein [Blastocatellia bacterium]
EPRKDYLCVEDFVTLRPKVPTSRKIVETWGIPELHPCPFGKISLLAQKAREKCGTHVTALLL